MKSRVQNGILTCVIFALHLHHRAASYKRSVCVAVTWPVLWLQIFSDMQIQGVQVDVVICCSMISALERGGQWQLAEQVVLASSSALAPPRVVLGVLKSMLGPTRPPDLHLLSKQTNRHGGFPEILLALGFARLCYVYLFWVCTNLHTLMFLILTWVELHLLNGMLLHLTPHLP